LAVRIRLQRCGQPKKPSYRIVVIDSRRQRDSQPIEYLGHYNPLTKEGNIGTVNNERLTYWLNCGAKLSDRVNSILKKFKECQAKQEGAV
jgi:small subunit ribosomal protein S16